jgi:hypothetical protein
VRIGGPLNRQEAGSGTEWGPECGHAAAPVPLASKLEGV